jgi:hypothetical protein
MSRARRRTARARTLRARTLRARMGGVLGLLGVAAGMLLLAAGAAYAYFQATDHSNPAAALAATLTAPTGGAKYGTATPSLIPITWTAPSGYSPTGYTVLRCSGSGCTPTSSPAVGGCSNVITSVVTTTSCMDSDTALAPNTTYTYEVEAVLDNWVSPPSSSFQGTTTAITKLTFTTQPSAGASIQAKGTGSFGVSVAIEDSNGAIDTNDNSDTVTLAIGTNPSGGVLSCTNAGGLTVTASSGVANFTGCAITKAGTGYKLTASSATAPSLAAPTNANAFNIIAGTASQLVLTTQPSVNQNIQATGTGSFPAAVSVEDANGNVETGDASTSVTLALGTNPSGGVLSCTNPGGVTVTDTSGVASFAGCAITLAGTGYELTASSSPSLTAPSNANGFNITAGTASQLVLTTQPTLNQNIQAKGTGSFPAAVSVEDANGNVETSDASTSVTLALGANPSGGVLSCANAGGLTASDVAGVATFTGCAITKVGAGYTLTASSVPSLAAPTNANAFNITAGTASQLAFTTQPASGANIQATGTGSFPVSVAVQDQNGNTVTTDSGRAVTLALGTNPSGGVLSCTNAGGLTVSDVSGVSSFTGCAITLVGTGYKLTASATSLSAPTNANAFNITAGAPDYLSFSNITVPLTGATTATCTPNASAHTNSCTINNLVALASFTADVTLLDQNGNPASSSSAITVSLSATNSGVAPASVTIPANSSTSSATFTETLSLGVGTVTATATINSVTFQSTITPGVL